MAAAAPGRPGSPRTRSVLGFAATLALVGAGVSALAAGLSESHRTPWSATPVVLILLTAAGYLIVRFQYRDDVNAIDLFEAVLAPTLFAFPPPVAVALAGTALLAANLARRNASVKAAFNTAQGICSAGIGSFVLVALRRGEALSIRNTVALVAAVFVVTVVNQVTFATVISIARGEPVRRVLGGLAPVIGPGWVLGWIVNTSFGVLFTATMVWSPWALGLASVPLVVLHFAYRGHASALADRARLAGLHRATRALAGPVDPREAIPQFLAEVQRCFEAGAAELVVIEEGSRLVHRVSGDVCTYRSARETWADESLAAVLLARGVDVRVAADGPDAIASALLALDGWRDCLASPLREGDRTVGILCVYDRGGLEAFQEGEMAVLAALANEAARAFVKAELLTTIIAEQNKLSEIVGRTSDGIMTMAPTGMIKTWNPALERITGYKASDMVGARSFGTVRPRDAAGVGVWLEHWAEDEAMLEPDLEIVTRSGDTRWLSCSYTRVCDADGRPSVLIVVARDATEARELERQKDDFVATVSHELRTPLTPIKGWAVTLLQLGEHLTSAQRDEGVEAILRHAERLERLITNILEVSRIERGLSDRREAIIDVTAVVEKVVGDFQAEHPARTVGLRMERGTYKTRGDEVWVEQILTNVLSNALKYSPADLPIEVTISGGDGIEVAVTDRGQGIPEAETERIFERFKRLGDHMTRSQGGTGLGLYIARQLARAIGGELTVRSAPGDGATFTLRLQPADQLLTVAS